MLGVIYHACAIVFVNIGLHIEFNLPRFTRSKDMMGPVNQKGSRDHHHSHLRVGCHPKANMAYLCTQLDIILASVVAGIWLGQQNLNDHLE